MLHEVMVNAKVIESDGAAAKQIPVVAGNCSIEGKLRSTSPYLMYSSLGRVVDRPATKLYKKLIRVSYITFHRTSSCITLSRSAFTYI